ncbi:MAG: hypothetical protein JNK44_16775 [Cyclobacteriaceae bacterium]|nr:hypothetical protein [Cyclobacteriaceae bacterium]
MDIVLKKMQLIEWLTRVEDEELIRIIEQVRRDSINDAYKTRTPSSLAEIEKKLDRAEADIVSGRIYSQRDIETYFKRKG